MFGWTTNEGAEQARKEEKIKEAQKAYDNARRSQALPGHSQRLAEAERNLREAKK